MRRRLHNPKVLEFDFKSENLVRLGLVVSMTESQTVQISIHEKDNDRSQPLEVAGDDGGDKDCILNSN